MLTFDSDFAWDVGKECLPRIIFCKILDRLKILKYPWRI